MSLGVTCWVEEVKIFALRVDVEEPEVARDIAIGVLQTRLHQQIVGVHHGMGDLVTRIVVETETEVVDC